MAELTLECGLDCMRNGRLFDRKVAAPAREKRRECFSPKPTESGLKVLPISVVIKPAMWEATGAEVNRWKSAAACDLIGEHGSPCGCREAFCRCLWLWVGLAKFSSGFPSAQRRVLLARNYRRHRGNEPSRSENDKKERPGRLTGPACSGVPSRAAFARNECQLNAVSSSSR